VPKASEQIEKLSFERLRLDKDSADKDVFISSLRCVEGESGKLSMIVTTPIRTSIKKEGSELVYMEMEDGSVAYKSIATNTGQWNAIASITKLGDNYAATFLQAKGGSQYLVSLTSTAEEYRANINKTTMEDIKYSVLDTIGAYVISFFSIIANLIAVCFVLLWPLGVDFFEWKFFFRNPLITFRIGVLAETFLMYFSIRRIYANEESVAFMPEILQHGLTAAGILLATAAIAYIIVRLYRRSKSDSSNFAELGLFILIHNIFIYFLYTAYIVRF
jgi:hypothetical protein